MIPWGYKLKIEEKIQQFILFYEYYSPYRQISLTKRLIAVKLKQKKRMFLTCVTSSCSFHLKRLVEQVRVIIFEHFTNIFRHVTRLVTYIFVNMFRTNEYNQKIKDLTPTLTKSSLKDVKRSIRNETGSKLAVKRLYVTYSDRQPNDFRQVVGRCRVEFVQLVFKR